MQLRAYALILMVTLLFGCGVHLSGTLVLYRSNETLSLATLIDRQRETDGLYFPLGNPAGAYKLAVYSERKPEIVIFGSSRAHREHQEFYRLPSYSMSGLVTSPDVAVQLLALLIPIHKPKFVVFNLDFYSFCSRVPLVPDATPTRTSGPPRGGAWQPVNQFAVVPRLIADGSFSPQDMADIALGNFDPTPKGIHLFGLIAIKRHLGFRLDGAVSEVDERMQDPLDFEAAKQEVLTGTKHYPAGCHYDPGVMADLEVLQQDADRSGIKLIILLPPVAPSVYRLFAAAPEGIYGYYATWLQEATGRHLPDIHVLVDGGEIGASDSEFADAVHGGDVSEARMLLKAAESPGTALARIIDRPFLERLVDTHAGKLVVEASYFRAARPNPNYARATHGAR
jgi:hypothetical protein